MDKEICNIGEVKIGDVLSKSLATTRRGRELPLLSLNHVSFVCKSVAKSVEFYEQVLGFVLVQRPSSFDFEGAWLFNHGIGIHLLQADEKTLLSSSSEVSVKCKAKINPKDNHISFQCTDMGLLIRRLEEMEMEYVKAVVSEGGIIVDQIFFHDPDGYMIEICNCQNLPVLPILPSSYCPLKKMITTATTSFHGKNGEMEVTMMMDSLANDHMFNLSV